MVIVAKSSVLAGKAPCIIITYRFLIIEWSNCTALVPLDFGRTASAGAEETPSFSICPVIIKLRTTNETLPLFVKLSSLQEFFPL